MFSYESLITEIEKLQKKIGENQTQQEDLKSNYEKELEKLRLTHLDLCVKEQDAFNKLRNLS